MFKDHRSISPFAILLAAGTVLYAFLALLIGWGIGIDGLIRHASTQTPMVPATALGFFATGLGLLAAVSGARRLAHALCGTVLALICITAFGQWVGWAAPTSLFFADLQEAERMAPVTEFGFVLAVFALNRLLAGSLVAVESIGIFGVSGAPVVAMLNVTGAIKMLGLGFLAGASLQTSILFALLFTALCLVSAENKPD
ncbi:hypothetical protein AB2B41_09090 [Marimonas sp. MJW-29]|uniref:Intracellular septation protein A n=1 Tax=Sulfitobacter sediminis TaxID=3234186 RepID=A0ABV3RMF4_9RHOB